MKNPVERFQWKRAEDIRRFPDLQSRSWDEIIPVLIVLPGYKYPETGFFVRGVALWFQVGSAVPVTPTHWQQLPGLPKHP